MPKPDPDYDLLPPSGGEKERGVSEIDQVILAAHALKLDSPIIHYRIVGDRIELWTIHGGPYTYLPPSGGIEGGAAPAKKVVKKKK